MTTKELLDWSEAHQIVKRAEESFIGYLDNWKKEHRDDFFDTFKRKTNLKLIRTELYSIQLTHIIKYTDLVYCNLDILYLGESIGTYRSVYSLDGSDADDMILFDKYIENTMRIGTVKVEIILEAIKQGYSIEAISKLVELDMELIKPLFES